MANNFTNDQEKIKKGRKNTFKDSDELTVTAAPRDQILKELKTSLDDDNMGSTIVEKWYQANADRQEWMDRQKDYLQTWDEFLVSTDNGPYEGSSSLHLPMPLVVAKTLHARFLQALVGFEPFFQARSRTSALVEKQDLIEDVMMYYLKDKANYDQGAVAAIDKWVWDWITIGSGVLKLRWDVSLEKYKDIEESFEVDMVQEVDDEGNIVEIPKIQRFEEPIDRIEKTFEGPVFETINFEDICIVKGDGCPQRADFVIERTFLTASELWTLVDRKVFNKKSVEKVIQGGNDYYQGSINQDVKSMRSQNSGEDNLTNETEIDRYEFLESYINMDVDGSGVNSKVVTWTHVRSKEICGANYLRRMHQSGKVPYFKADYHLRRNQEHGIGIIEMMYPLSVEMDAMHNMRIDFGILSTMPFGFYRPTSSMEPEKLNLEPGALIPVDNPQTDIVFPNLGNRTSFGMQEEQAIMNMLERLSGVNEMTMGMMGQQGAARTATGAQALVNESSANLDVHLRRLNIAWKDVLKFLFTMLQQRMPDGLEFRLTGDDGADRFRQVQTKDEIKGHYDIEIDSNSSSSNRMIRIQNADTAAQLQQDQLAVQLGLVGPREIYEAKKSQLMARGIKDFYKYFKEPVEQRIFSPKEVVDRLLRGVETPVTMQDDHEGIIKYIDFLLNDDKTMGQFTEQDAISLSARFQQQQQMLQALDQMAAQQRNTAQMQQNQAQGQDQTLPMGEGSGAPEGEMS